MSNDTVIQDIIDNLNKRDPYGKTATAGATFTLTKEHIALLHRTYVDWNDDAYKGAPAVGLKRPYGHSSVIADVVEILLQVNGIDVNMTDHALEDFVSYDREGEVRLLTLPSGRKLTYDDLMVLHRQTETALQIVLCTLSFVPGEYRKARQYDARSWQRVASV